MTASASKRLAILHTVLAGDYEPKYSIDRFKFPAFGNTDEGDAKQIFNVLLTSPVQLTLLRSFVMELVKLDGNRQLGQVEIEVILVYWELLLNLSYALKHSCKGPREISL